MADEVSRISLAVDTRSVRSAETDLKRFGAAGDTAAASTTRLSGVARGLGTALGGIALGTVISNVIKQADAYSNLNARLRLATTSAQEFAKAQSEVFAISQQTGTGLAQTADLYGSLSRSTESLGVNQQQVLDVTRTINQALAVSGTSAGNASAALVQLGQAFASGVLRGEELNSVLEQAPRLARAIADGLGVTVGSLKTLGEQGKLTAEDVFKALQSSAGAINAEFSQLPITVGRASTEAANALQKLIGAIDSTTETTATLAGAISDAAGFMSDLADQIERVSRGQETASSLSGVLAESFQTVSETLRILAANVSFVFKGVGREIGAVAAQIVALASLDINGFNAISRAVREDAERARRELDDFERRVLGRYNFDDRAGAGRGTAPDPRSLGTPDPIPRARRQVTSAPRPRGGSRAKPQDDSAAIAKAELHAELQAIRAALSERTALYSANERVLEAVRGAGLISEREYYNAKRAFIQLDLASEQQAIQAEIDRLQKQKVTGKDAIAIKQQIAEAQSRLAIVNADAAAKTEIAGIQEQQALQKISQAYAAAEDAARSFLDAQTLQQNRALDSVGKGAEERKRQEGRQQIEDRYSQQRQQLEQARITGQIEQQQYQEQLARIRAYQAAALSSYDEYYSRLKAQELDYRNGVNEALANYITQADNTASQVENLFSDAFKGMEDALVDFVTTGKLDFDSLVDTIVSGVTRIIVQQQLIKPLASLIGQGANSAEGAFANILGSLFGGGRATGGPVQAGTLYEINETGRGPGEIYNVGGRQYLMPNANGSVQTNQAGAGGGASVVNNFYLSSPADKRTQQQVATAAGQGVQRALARNN